jgi:hypothetical protein
MRSAGRSPSRVKWPTSRTRPSAPECVRERHDDWLLRVTHRSSNGRCTGTPTRRSSFVLEGGGLHLTENDPLRSSGATSRSFPGASGTGSRTTAWTTTIGTGVAWDAIALARAVRVALSWADFSSLWTHEWTHGLGPDPDGRRLWRRHPLHSAGTRLCEASNTPRLPPVTRGFWGQDPVHPQKTLGAGSHRPRPARKRPSTAGTLPSSEPLPTLGAPPLQPLVDAGGVEVGSGWPRHRAGLAVDRNLGEPLRVPQRLEHGPVTRRSARRGGSPQMRSNGSIVNTATWPP